MKGQKRRINCKFLAQQFENVGKPIILPQGQTGDLVVSYAYIMDGLANIRHPWSLIPTYSPEIFPAIY